MHFPDDAPGQRLDWITHGLQRRLTDVLVRYRRILEIEKDFSEPNLSQYRV